MSSCLPTRFCLESIEKIAEAKDEITTALSSKPTNMTNVVTYASRVVTGSISRGTIEVTNPAPHRKA